MSHLEEWRPVREFEGLYEVSNLGHVRNVARRQGTSPGRLLSPGLHWTGYFVVSLSSPSGRQDARVHRLVADAFIRPGSDHEEVNHRDGGKTNNAASNLEWVSRPDNQRHAVGMGLQGTKLTPEQAIEIRALAETLNHSQLSRRFGVSRTTIRRVANGQWWGLTA